MITPDRTATGDRNLYQVTEKYAQKVERLKAKRAAKEARQAAEAAAKFEAWAAQKKPNKKPPRLTLESKALIELEAEALAHMRDIGASLTE